MELEELGKRLRSIADLDAAAAYARFQAETGSADLDEFLRYLRDRDLISGGAFCAVHAAAPIRVSAILPAPATAAAAARPVVPIAEALAPASPSAMTVVPAGAAAAIASPPPAASSAAAAQSAQYRVLGRIGAGAMGEVLIARDGELGRTVAYKRMLPELAGNAGMASRFYAEAQITAQLDHPNVVSIYDLEVGADQTCGYAMKLVEGRHLGKVIDEARRQLTTLGRRDEPARLTERLRWFLAVCDAIAFAHGKGVLHRDLKPENIMVGRHGEVYVMDWGICRLIGAPDEDPAAVEERVGSGAHGRTRYGAIIGTPAYMSPEQAAGKVPELDGRSDQYALGLILYELVALRPAMPDAPLDQTLAAATRGEKAPLGRHVLGAPIAKDLAAIIARATALRPDDRYPDVAAFARDLRAFLRGDPVTARRDNPVERVQRWIGRHKGLTLIILLATLLAAAAAAVVGLLVHQRRLDAAHARSERIEAYQLAVARQGHDLDAAFFRYERALARFAGEVGAVLASSDQSDARAFFNEDFADVTTPGVAPGDLAASRHYGKPASLDAAVFQLARGVDRATVAADVRRLVRLRPAFTALMLETAPPSADPSASPRTRILDEGVPVFRVFVTLAGGLHVSYPGIGGYAPDYDGTRRPKYLLASMQPAGDARIVWGKPVPDLQGHGLIIPAATRLDLADGRFAGVAGLEMTFDWMADNLLPMPRAPYVDAVYLVRRDGDVVVGTDAAFRTIDELAHHPNADVPEADLDPLPYPAVRDAIAHGRRTHVAITVDGRRKLVAFSPISALDWTYVVVADEARLLAAPAP